MKQFNLEAAKQGAPVCTNIGEPVEIIKYDYRGEHPIIAIVDQGERQVARLYDLDGKHRYRDDFLMMASTKHKKYIVLKKEEGRYRIASDVLFPTVELAKCYKRNCKGATTILKIEWEE